MISFFPTPYPNELWYSMIARYHKYCGTLSWQATIEHLFQGAKSANVGSFFPNETIHQVLSQLPPGFLSPRDKAFEVLIRESADMPKEERRNVQYHLLIEPFARLAECPQ